MRYGHDGDLNDGGGHANRRRAQGVPCPGLKASEGTEEDRHVSSAQTPGLEKLSIPCNMHKLFGLGLEV